MRLFGILFAGALMLLCRPALALDGEEAGTQQQGQRAAISPENLALATRHFDEATRLYRAGKFNEARIEFEASLALTGEVELLHNLSLTAERQGKLSEAIGFEERFLAAKPESLTQRDSDEARGRIARLREQLASVATMPQSVSGRAPTSATEHRRVPPGAIGLLVLGSAAVVVGIGCGAGAWSAARTIDGMPLTVTEAEALTSRGQALDRAGITLDVVGAAALVAGTTWSVLAGLRARKNAEARAETPLSPHALAWSNQ